ncbi:MAG: hypothetical protein WBD28_05985 [Candidatus Zixiibacteriota bacterium]
MFDEVFGGINFGAHTDKRKCPCGCTCLCWNGEEERVSNTNSRATTVHASEYAQDPTPN